MLSLFTAQALIRLLGAMVLIALSGFVPVALMVSLDRNYDGYYAGYWPQLGQMAPPPHLSPTSDFSIYISLNLY